MRSWIMLCLCCALGCTMSGQKESAQPAAMDPTRYLLPGVGDSAREQGEPMLHTDPNGVVYLTWIEQVDSTGHQLQLSRLTDSGWSEARTIAAGRDWFVNWADFPQFASDGNGHHIATYLQKSGPGKYTYDVMMTVSSNGNPWSAPVKLNEDGKDAEHGFVSIAPNPQGFLVSWLDGRKTNPMPEGAHAHADHSAGQMTVRVALLDFQGKKQWEDEVDDRTCDCCQTAVAWGPEGPVLVYRDRSAREIRDIYVARRVAGKWIQTALHSDEWEINGCPVNGPHIEVRDKLAAAAWYTEAGKKPSVLLKWSTDGGQQFGRPLRLNDSIPLGRVDLVITDDRRAMVCWMEGTRILARSVDSHGQMGMVQTIGWNSAKRSAGFPQMTLSGMNLVFAWTDAETKRIQTVRMAYLPR